MRENVKISPSMLSANFMELGVEVGLIKKGGADWAHIDVMDGHFVPNITMGVPMVSALKKFTDMPLDVHLMITNPLIQIPWFIDAGADIITFHIEACENADEAIDAIRLIKESNIPASVAIKPKTPIEAIAPLLGEVDMVLVMSVEPGFSGQGFLEGSDNRIRQVRKLCADANVDPMIQVDGGIGPLTIARVIEAGATSVVCGNAVFKSGDPARAIREIREAIQCV